MKSEDKWLREQVEIAKSVIRGESHCDAFDIDGHSEIAALILATTSNHNAIVEW